MNRKTVLTLILIVAILTPGMIMIKPASAQSIPAPTVPQFTIKQVSQGDNVTVEILVQNQRLSFSNSSYHLYYTVLYKLDSWGPYAGIELYPTSVYATGPAQSGSWLYDTPHGVYLANDTPAESTSDYTVISVPQNDLLGGVNDFQVEAIVGFNSYYFEGGNYVPAVALGNSSGWSAWQTITLPDSIVSSIPTSSPLQTSSAPSASSPTISTVPKEPTSSPGETSVSGAPSVSVLLLTNAVALVVIAVLLAVIIALLIIRRQKTIN